MRAAITLLVILALGASACASDDTPTSGGPVVVATTSIWADVVGNVGCEGLVEVQTIVPVGADPHAFEPSLADRGRLDDATLIVANGLGLEEGLADTLDATPTPVFAMTDHVATLAYATDDDAEHDEEHGEDEAHDDEHDDEHDEEHGEDEAHDEEHDHDGADPHIWLDPARVVDAIDPLADELVSSVGLDAEAVDACVAAYRDELRSLDDETATTLAAVPTGQRALVTNHDSLGYLADRYDFEVIGTVIPTPSGLGATNPAQLEALAELIEQRGVPAIFSETQVSADDAEALAARVGDVEVVTLRTGTLDEPGSGADTYVGLIRTNAELIADALS